MDSKVIFHDISDQYVTNADIFCHFSFGEDLYYKANNYIDLISISSVNCRTVIDIKKYKVIFKLPPIPCMVWSEPLKVYKQHNWFWNLRFYAKELPKPVEGCVYQFRFRTNDGIIEGTSKHFRLVAPKDEHLIEERHHKVIPIIGFSGEFATQSEDVKELKKTIDELSEQRKSLRMKSIEDMSELMDSRLESEAKRKRINALELSLEEMKTKNNELNTRLTTTSEEYQKSCVENTRLKESIDEMKTKVKNYFETKSQQKCETNVLSDRLMKDLMVRAKTDLKSIIGSELGVEVLDSESVVSDNTSIATVSEDQELEETVINGKVVGEDHYQYICELVSKLKRGGRNCCGGGNRRDYSSDLSAGEGYTREQPETCPLLSNNP